MKVGLALGGGGAKGTYQLGVLKALEEYNLLDQINVITGTSIGAINTMLFLNFENVNNMIKVWEYINNKLVFKKRVYFSRSLFDLGPLFIKTSSYIKSSNLEKSKYQAYITASKLVNNSFKYHNLRRSNLELEVFHLNSFSLPKRAVLASASIPAVFKPTVIYDQVYVDGGLIDRYTIDLLIEKECDILLLVPLDNYYDLNKYQDSDKMIINFSARNVFHDSKIIDLADTIMFERTRLDHKYIYGYLATKKMIKDLIKQNVIVDEKFIFTPKIFEINKEFDDKLFKKMKMRYK